MGQGVGQILVVSIEELHGIFVEGHGQRTGCILCNHALELHQHDIAIAAVIAGADNEHLGLLGELCLGSVHGRLQTGSSGTGTLNVFQTIGNRQFQLDAVEILNGTHRDGVGDGITGFCLINVCSNLNVGGCNCDNRNHSSNQAKHDDSTQDQGDNTLAHNQAPF